MRPKISRKGKTLTVIPNDLVYGKSFGVTQAEAEKRWAKGFMSGVKVHPTFYTKRGIRKIKIGHRTYRVR